MVNTTEVSIGMPVYNDSKFLRKSLDSILSQTFTNYELIISDDASTDGSEDICKEYAQKNIKIRYIRQEKNIGISRNMKFLLNQSNSEYFMWAGNDDLWDKDFVKSLISALKNNKTAVSAFCPMVFIDENDKILSSPAPRSVDYSGSSKKIRLNKLIKQFDDCFGYGLFRRDEIKEVHFPVWKLANRTCAYNNIYPTLCYYLTKGDFVLAGDRPMWFNRLKNDSNINHKVPFADSKYLRFIYFILRKINLVYEAIIAVSRAESSIITAIQIFPSMFFRWFLIPARSEFIQLLSRR